MLIPRRKPIAHIEGLLYPFPTSVPVSIEPESISHTGRDQHAVDFLVPEGTTVLVPRAGRVQEVKDDSDVGGPDRQFENDANYVVIKLNLTPEDPGFREEPYSRYVYSILIHLQQGSVTVKPGDWVEEGQEIGRQGSTGWTYAPHIHFAVYKCGVTIPVGFMPRKRRIKKWW